MHYSSSREGWKCLPSDIKTPAFPFLLTCPLLFPLLAILVGWLTYWTSSPSKTEKLSITDGDGNWKEKERHLVIISHISLNQKLPSSAPVRKLLRFVLLSFPDLCPFFPLFLHTRVPILIFFFFCQGLFIWPHSHFLYHLSITCFH